MPKSRHLLLAAFAAAFSLAGAGQASAQSYRINEGFEGNAFPPAGWTTIDADGDGHCWQAVGKGNATLNGEQIAVSYACNPETGTDYAAQDNWLITPQINVTNDAFSLKYRCVAEDIDASEYYEVWVSETGTAQADFTHKLTSETLENDYGVYLNLRTFSLSQFKGKKIYIAFRHKSSQTYALGIDDVQVLNQAAPCELYYIQAEAADDGTSVTLKWTNSTQTGAGQPLAADGLAAVVYRDGVAIATLTDGVTPGADMQYTDTNVPQGNHTYGVAMRNAEGETTPATSSLYIGMDSPAAIDAVSTQLNAVTGKATISWAAPGKGAHEGKFDPATVTYTVTRNAGGQHTVLATGLAATTYTDTPEPGVPATYTVTPGNSVGQGEGTTSGQVIYYGSQYKDINIAPDANTGYANPKIPFDMGNKSYVTQLMVYPDELSALKGDIHYLVLKNSFRAAIDKPVQVYMAETDEADLAKGWLAAKDMTKVYDGTLAMPEGANDVPLHLDTPFQYSGRNLVVMFYMQPSQASGGYFDRWFVQSEGARKNRTRNMGSYSGPMDLDNLDATDGASDDKAVPYLRFVIAAKDVAAVSGTVTSAADGKPVPGATVQTAGYTATTAADGSYSLYIVPSGKQTLTVKAKGYDDFVKEIDVPAQGEMQLDVTLQQRALVTVSGQARLDGVGAAQGVKVTLDGYSDGETVTDAQGNYSIKVFKGEDYTLTYAYPLFNSVTRTLDGSATAQDIACQTTVLERSLIAPYGVKAQVADNGEAATVAWEAPDTRTGKIQWTHLGQSDTHNSTSGDFYSSSDFFVAHAFTAKTTADSAMVGMSIAALKAWVKSANGTVTACVWRGNKTEHELLASAPMATDNETGGWATAQFPTPVEVKAGEDYMVGLHLVGADDDPVGVAGYGSCMNGVNCLKWSDVADTYDGWYAWNISAQCVVPGSNGLYGKPDVTLPAPTYSVYRTTGAQGAEPVLLKEGLSSRTYTDNTWTTAAPAAYTYTVKAVYATGKGSEPSLAALSNTLERQLDTDGGVTAILSPARSIAMQNSASVKVQVKNFGEKPIGNVTVKVDLSDGQKLSATYSGTLNKDEQADVAVGEVTLKPETYYTIKAYTVIEGDNFAADDTATVTLPNYTDVRLCGFRWDPYDNLGVMDIHPNMPESAVFRQQVMPNDYRISTGEYVDGRYYAFTGEGETYAPREFVVLDTLTWNPVRTAPLNTLVFDVTYDYTSSKMYALAMFDSNKLALATVSLEDGSFTWINPVDKKLSTLACNAKGVLYGIASDGHLYTVNKTTGVCTEVGATGIEDIQLYHSMTFDRRSGRLFWAHNGYQSSGELYELNPDTGAAQFLGKVMYQGYPSHTVGLYIPYDKSATGITAPTANNDHAAKGAMYDLAGRRISNANGVKVYIQDGKKFLKVKK